MDADKAVADFMRRLSGQDHAENVATLKAINERRALPAFTVRESTLEATPFLERENNQALPEPPKGEPSPPDKTLFTSVFLVYVDGVLVYDDANAALRPDPIILEPGNKPYVALARVYRDGVPVLAYEEAGYRLYWGAIDTFGVIASPNPAYPFAISGHITQTSTYYGTGLGAVNIATGEVLGVQGGFNLLP